MVNGYDGELILSVLNFFFYLTLAETEAAQNYETLSNLLAGTKNLSC